jgi:hypothetical protein
VGDAFQDCYKFKLRELSPNEHAVTHEKNFIPSGHFKVGSSSYLHETEGVKPKVIHKDQDGKVPLEPKNFLTSPPRVGIANATVK